MNRKILTTILVASLIFLAIPREAYARNVLRDIGRGLRRGARFVVTLPDKITRPLGPVLGPLAADLLTQNLIRNPNIGRYFRHARNIDRVAGNVEEQRRLLLQAQTDLRNQAKDLALEAETVRNYRRELAGDVVKGEISFDEFKDKVISLENLAESYDRLAEKFDKSADNIKPERVVRAVGQNVFNRLIREVRDGVRLEIQNEIRRYVRPEVISLVTGRGLDIDRIIDMLVEKDVAAATEGMSEEEAAAFKNRVRDRLKETIEANRQGLKANWRQEIRSVIERVRKDLVAEKEKLDQKKTSVMPEKGTTPAGEKQPPPGNLGKCPPGYTYSPRSGTDCIQTNCNEIQSGHWDYTGHCVCGSSGSVNENPADPNKECILPHENAACPGCLFACVGLEDECPKPPKQ